jgi:peptidoglycan/LPS O-acetylase OafA/YrhL
MRARRAPRTPVSSEPSPDGAAAEPRRAAGAGRDSRLRALDALRLCAALMVAVFHYLARDNNAWGQHPGTIFPSASVAAPYGWLGVEIFFVISGLVICMSCWGRTVRSFFVSRVTRLYPAYWVAVLLTTAVVSVVHITGPRPDTSTVLANLTMLQNPFGADDVDWVYWTLWVEMRFYLMFALLIAWRALSYRLVIGFCMVWTVLAAVAAQSGQALLSVVFMPSAAPYFIVGVAIYLLHRFGHNLLTWGVLGVNAAIGMRYAVGRGQGYSGSVVATTLNNGAVIAILAGAIVLIIAIARGRLDWVRWQWVTVAGALTYPFYLVHERIGWAMIRVLYVHWHLSAYVVLPAVLAAMLVLAYAIHRLVERPVAPLLKRALAQVPLDAVPLSPRTGPASPGERSRDGVGAVTSRIPLRRSAPERVTVPVDGAQAAVAGPLSAAPERITSAGARS